MGRAWAARWLGGSGEGMSSRESGLDSTAS